MGPTKRGKGTKLMVVADAAGLPVAAHTTRARPAEVTLVGPTTATGDSPPPSASDQSFVATGHSGLPVHRLTLEELHAIERTGDTEVPFALTASQP